MRRPRLLLCPWAVTVGLLLSTIEMPEADSRPPDIPFTIHLIDGGASETAAVADLNGDGKADIISGEHWYEAPAWRQHRFRTLDYTNGYIDAFSDLPLDVDGDGAIDLVTVSWFGKKIAWWKNPGARRGQPQAASRGDAAGAREPQWTEATVESGFPVEFAFLVDLDNDGKAQEVLPQFGDPKAPLAWYEATRGTWRKHVISSQSYGHGIGAGDVNGDGRADVLTPKGWFEGPADPRAEGACWTQHADWDEKVQLGFLYAIDLNGDGRKDVLTTAAHDYGQFWYEQGAAAGAASGGAANTSAASASTTSAGPASASAASWTRRVLDQSWSQAHATTMVDLNGDGRPDLVTGKRYMAHNGNDPGEREPLGVYWYEHRRTSSGGLDWIRHVIDYGGRMGGGMQIPVVDLDGDGDLDLVCAGKSGLFLIENRTKTAAARRP